MPVARIGESVSYSDKLKEQAQLINKRRQQNLNVEIAQEEKNRQFRDQQLQTFYDFDVSGMSAEHIKAIGKLQANMANSLDPNSEDHYQNTQQLIADISFLNNAYNVASRHRDQRQSGAQQMVGLMTGEVKAGPGEEFVNEGIDGLNNANALWDQGGFSGEINVGGSAGNRSMSGVPLVPNPDGGWMSGEGEVSFFENSLTNDSSPLYRPTIIASAPALNKMAEDAMSDEALNGTNTEEVANLRWSTMNRDEKKRIAEEEYNRLKTDTTEPFETMTPEQKKDMGIDDESLRDKYRDKLQEGVDARGTAPGADAFDFNKSIKNMPVLNEPIQIKTENEEYTGIGKVEGAQYVKGLDLDSLPVRGAQGQPRIPIEVAFVKNGLITKKTIDPATNPEEYSDFMESLGSRGREQLLAYSDYYKEPGGPEVQIGDNDPDTSNRTNPSTDDDVRRSLGVDPENADSTPNAKLESDRQLLLDDIADAEEELRFQTGLGAGNAGNAVGKIEAMTKLVELQEKLGPMNDALEALGIERIESEPLSVDELPQANSTEPIGPDPYDPPQDPVAEVPGIDPPQNPTAADPELIGPQPETERDLSALPPLSPIAEQVSIGVSASEGYNENMQINVPDTLNSGVTIAGIDIGSTAGGTDGKMEIFEVFLRPEDYEALKPMVGLTGVAAQEALAAAQAKGLLLQDGLGLEGDDFAQMAAYHISMHQLPAIYKKIPKKHFEKMDQEVKDIFINIEFMTPGTSTPKLVLKAIKSGKKKDWEAVANAYYNPNTGSTYYGGKELTDQKIANSEMENPPEDAKSIGRGNVKRVKEAGDNLRAWIEKTYG